ncbi:MAG: c-type cytochrome [Bacteroidetes bacterium]|nr:c-type cytochrome [Bacteroidota bacterium]
MKLLTPFFRVLIFAIVAFGLFEFIVDSGDQFAIQENPLIQAIFWGLVILAIFIEIVIGTVKSNVYNSLSEEAREKYEQMEADSYFGKLYAKLLDSRDIEDEGEIILDHDYDGIKELDNTLPPWWVYLFYATIIFAVVYLARYHIFDGDHTTVEYDKEVTQAKIDIEEYKKNNPDLVDASSVVLLTEEADLAAGKVIFDEKCAVCHKNDGGGGIGPNLTDENWILGGGIKNVFTTVYEGGRDGKGMVSWKSELKANEIAQVSSYLLGFQGTTPAAPKAAEGDIWVNDSN